MKLEWEVEPLGVMLNGLDTQTAVDWSDTGTGGAALSEQAVDLVEAKGEAAERSRNRSP